MLMQETGTGNLGLMLFGLGALAMITMVLWIFLPFSIFGVKAILKDILAEQRRTTSAVSTLNRDVREIAREALQPDHHKQIPPR